MPGRFVSGRRARGGLSRPCSYRRMTLLPLSPMTATTCGGPVKLRKRASSSASVSPLRVYG